MSSGLYLRPVKMGDGFSIGGSETAGESFQEFSLGGVECRDKVYPPYPGDPENDWPVLLYEVPHTRTCMGMGVCACARAYVHRWASPERRNASARN